MHRRAQRALLATTLVVTTACHSFQHAPSLSNLGASGTLVRVRYATPQRLHALAAGRDTVIADVTIVEGRPTSVRGDTLQLRLTRWYAGGWFGHRQPPRLDLVVAPQAGVILEQQHVDAAKTAGAVLVGIGIIVAIVAVAFSVGMSSLGPNY